jgi:hypothetical protein
MEIVEIPSERVDETKLKQESESTKEKKRGNRV